MKKKMIILFITCSICLFNISDIGSQESGSVLVIVKDRHYNPVSWAYVSVENMTCWSIGYGYYTATTSPGPHLVFVSGRVYWINVKPGYNLVHAYGL